MILLSPLPAQGNKKVPPNIGGTKFQSLLLSLRRYYPNQVMGIISADKSAPPVIFLCRVHYSTGFSVCQENFCLWAMREFVLYGLSLLNELICLRLGRRGCPVDTSVKQKRRPSRQARPGPYFARSDKVCKALFFGGAKTQEVHSALKFLLYISSSSVSAHLWRIKKFVLIAECTLLISSLPIVLCFIFCLPPVFFYHNR